MDVDFTKNIICCVLIKSYTVDNNISCIIQAIKQGNCSSYKVESPNEVSSNVSVAHLPHDQILCFVAEAKILTSTVILMGSFSTSTGCNHMPVLNSINFILLCLLQKLPGVFINKPLLFCPQLLF